mmetsp:Transcript_24883/g.79851  ORF Transcript_24883/g.79851 Transcript_24883/m.79851 type:complete len:230 (+) Transcript_24883:666-1355(+)
MSALEPSSTMRGRGSSTKLTWLAMPPGMWSAVRPARYGMGPAPTTRPGSGASSLASCGACTCSLSIERAACRPGSSSSVAWWRGGRRSGAREAWFLPTRRRTPTSTAWRASRRTTGCASSSAARTAPALPSTSATAAPRWSARASKVLASRALGRQRPRPGRPRPRRPKPRWRPMARSSPRCWPAARSSQSRSRRSSTRFASRARSLPMSGVHRTLRCCASRCRKWSTR